MQAFKDFHRFLAVRKATEIEAAFGVVLADPVDEFNASRHVGNDSPSMKAPPTPLVNMDDFFAFFVIPGIATARKFAHSGSRLRLDPHALSRWPASRCRPHRWSWPTCILSRDLLESCTCVSPGKGTEGSGASARGGCRMLDQLDLILGPVPQPRLRQPRSARVKGHAPGDGKVAVGPTPSGDEFATGRVICSSSKAAQSKNASA